VVDDVAKLWLLRAALMPFTRLLAVLFALAVVFANPASALASFVEHHDCHHCEEASHAECGGEMETPCDGDHECPCIGHSHSTVAVVVAPLPIIGPQVRIVDWLTAWELIPVEGEIVGIEHPPQNA
jgi:hypothetical protein